MQRAGDIAIYYNAWENDDCDSAIHPLLYNIISVSNDGETENYIEHMKYFMKTLGMNTLKFGLDKLLGDYKKIADIVSNSIDAGIEEDIKTIFSEYDEYYGKRRKLKNSLEELIPNEGNLWVFVDDLDRCTPSFAINTLECIKHFFNIEHIIFVFAIDYNQLLISAEKIYGMEVDSTSYMKKFFDVIYRFPSPNTKDYINYKIQSIQNENIRNFIRDDLLLYFFKLFDFSLRDIDLTMTHLELFISEHERELSRCEEMDKALKVYYYFMCIKDKYNREYLEIIHGHFSVDSKKHSNWPQINQKFIVDNEIKKMLESISNGKAEKHTVDIMERYSLIKTTPLINKFAYHMEFILR